MVPERKQRGPWAAQDAKERVLSQDSRADVSAHLGGDTVTAWGSNPLPRRATLEAESSGTIYTSDAPVRVDEGCVLHQAADGEVGWEALVRGQPEYEFVNCHTHAEELPTDVREAGLAGKRRLVAQALQLVGGLLQICNRDDHTSPHGMILL